jgi:hypothetical protein
LTRYSVGVSYVNPRTGARETDGLPDQWLRDAAKIRRRFAASAFTDAVRDLNLADAAWLDRELLRREQRHPGRHRREVDERPDLTPPERPRAHAVRDRRTD